MLWGNPGVVLKLFWGSAGMFWVVLGELNEFGVALVVLVCSEMVLGWF
jgi:hypothetical protein